MNQTFTGIIGTQHKPNNDNKKIVSIFSHVCMESNILMLEETRWLVQLEIRQLSVR